MAIQPVQYSSGQSVLGHYAVAQKSGATASLSAVSPIARIRWVPTGPALFCVLMRVKVGWTVTGAVTAATPMDVDAIVARQFTVDFTTAMTQINLANVLKTNATRSFMAGSAMGTAGPGICTTTIMSGQTYTLDNAPFAVATFTNQPSGNATVTQAVGVGATMQTLYEWTGLGQHPIVLAANEGVVLRNVTAGPTTGTVAYYAQWEWAEVLAF